MPLSQGPQGDRGIQGSIGFEGPEVGGTAIHV